MANIFETARAEQRVNKFSRGIESAAGLVQTLSGPGPFTIFVPTDAAFDQLSDDQQANLLGDPGKLTKLLQYHIVPGLYTADDMLDHIFLKTLEGQRLRVWADIYETPLGEEELIMGSCTSLIKCSSPIKKFYFYFPGPSAKRSSFPVL